MLANQMDRERLPAYLATERYYAERKLDGIRAVVAKVAFGLNIWTRGGHDIAFRVGAQVKNELYAMMHDGDIIDGELCLVDSWAPSRFDGLGPAPTVNFAVTAGITNSLPSTAQAKQEEFGCLTYFPFDMLRGGVTDLRRSPLAARAKMLRLSVYETDYVRPLDYVQIKTLAELDELFSFIVEDGGEGLMLKDHASQYSPGRAPSGDWIKVKQSFTTEVVIMGYTKGTGKYSDTVGAVKYGQYKGEAPALVLVERGQCSGMTDEQRYAFDGTDIGRVIEISHNGHASSTPGFRHPNFVRFRDDKRKEDCLWDG
jgi:ATP-dependent DNA ligase